MSSSLALGSGDVTSRRCDAVPCTGNILVGARARVAAGSMVLKPVAEDMLVAGNPAKVIGKLVDVGKDGHQLM